MIIGNCPVCGAEMRVGTDMTNADHIRNMTDEELADFLCKIACNTTPVGYYHIEGWLEWLKQESENLNEQTN